jgi:hypothetical protein
MPTRKPAPNFSNCYKVDMGIKDPERRRAYDRAYYKTHKRYHPMRDRLLALEQTQKKLVQIASHLQNQFLPSSKRIKLS